MDMRSKMVGKLLKRAGAAMQRVGQRIGGPRGGRVSRFFLLDIFRRSGVGAEVGVWTGEWSSKLLEYTEPQKLYLIDPYELVQEASGTSYDGTMKDYDGVELHTQADMDALHGALHRRFGGRQEVSIMRMGSQEAASQIEDGSLDWVYIDGDHFYEPTKRDLEAYLPKVKPGGIIAGDDYSWGEEHKYPVKRAVDEFGTRTENIDLEMIQNEQYVFRKRELKF